MVTPWDEKLTLLSFLYMISVTCLIRTDNILIHAPLCILRVPLPVYRYVRVYMQCYIADTVLLPGLRF